MGLEMLENPEHGSRPRNKLVAQVFYDMHLIEHYGSGTRRIKDECLKNGNRFPRWSQQYGSFITVYDSRLKKDEPKIADTIIGTIKAADDTINLQREPLNEPLNEPLKMFVLQKVRESPGISRPALIALTKKSRATITRALSFLQSKALIELNNLNGKKGKHK